MPVTFRIVARKLCLSRADALCRGCIIGFGSHIGSHVSLSVSITRPRRFCNCALVLRTEALGCPAAHSWYILGSRVTAGRPRLFCECIFGTWALDSCVDIGRPRTRVRPSPQKFPKFETDVLCRDWILCFNSGGTICTIDSVAESVTDCDALWFIICITVRPADRTLFGDKFWDAFIWFDDQTKHFAVNFWMH